MRKFNINKALLFIGIFSVILFATVKVAMGISIAVIGIIGAFLVFLGLARIIRSYITE